MRVLKIEKMMHLINKIKRRLILICMHCKLHAFFCFCLKQEDKIKLHVLCVIVICLFILEKLNFKLLICIYNISRKIIREKK